MSGGWISDLAAGGGPDPAARSAEPPRAPGAWGILGGTFDPIHYAHLAIAEQTREALGLTGVLFVPAGMPPHKAGQIVSTAAHRVEMVRLAIADNPSFVLSRVDVDRSGPSYSVDSVGRLLEAPPSPWDPEAGFVFIVSAEALVGLRTWHEPERLLDLCRLAVVPRRGYSSPGRPWVAEHFPDHVDRVLFLDGPDLGHSASAIRERVAHGRSIRYLVPPAVDAYIREHHLYPMDTWRRN